MISCLEKVSMDERHEEIARNDYNSLDQYSKTHKDALSTGDAQGKGSGHQGHTHWLPNCNGELGVIDYRNFDTDINSNIGNCNDVAMRTRSLARSLYSHVNVYSERLIDRSNNIAEGQYVFTGVKSRTDGCFFK